MKLFKSVLIVTLGMYSIATFANCSNSVAVCTIYKNEKIIKKSKCHVDICESTNNAFSIWRFKDGTEINIVPQPNYKATINQQDGHVVYVEGIETCYATDKKPNIHYCTDDKYFSF